MSQVNVTQSGTTPIATDIIGGVHYQKTKITIGNDGVDGGTVSTSNPLPVSIKDTVELPVNVNSIDDGVSIPVLLETLARRLMQVFGRFSFSNNSSLRVEVQNTVPTTISSGTVTTVTTMTTGNMGFGDIGKASTAQLVSQQSFQCGIGRNFVRS